VGEEKLHQKIFYHLIGTDFEKDPLVFGRGLNKDDLPNPINCLDEKNLLNLVYVGAEKVDYYLNNQLIFKEADTSSSGYIHKDTIYISNGNQILAANLNDPLNWKVVFSETADKLEKFILIENSLIIQSLENVTSYLSQYDLNGNYLSSIPLPCAGLITEWSVNEHNLIFGFSSFFIPHTIYQFNTYTKELSVLNEVKTLFNPDEFVLRQEFFLAKDSAKIPLFIIHKKGISLSGNNPLLLYGYGGFAISIFPNFNPFAIPFLEHGGIYVIANIRGGGEFSESWHQAGVKKNKQTVFNDFIGASEWLIENKYTNSSKLAILGGSNGGLLTGAMLTQRPDLFKAVLIGVPVLDMLRYHLFFGGRFWIPEYGSPDDPEAYNYLLKYSPYHHVNDDIIYPSTLIFTSDADDRVHPMHAYKMTARLNAVKHPGKTLR
jgi:prolyl oligopeptidase